MGCRSGESPLHSCNRLQDYKVLTAFMHTPSWESCLVPRVAVLRCSARQHLLRPSCFLLARPPPPPGAPGLVGPPPPQQRPGLLQVGHGVPFTAGGGSALRESAPEFRPGSPSKPVQLQPLADAVSWINGAVMAAMEGQSCAWSPRARRVKGTLLTICTPAGANFEAPSDPGAKLGLHGHNVFCVSDRHALWL